MQRRLSKSTIPSARRYNALVGQITVQGESSQWLHRITRQYTGEDYPDPTIDIVLVAVRLERATFSRIERFDDTWAAPCP